MAYSSSPQEFAKFWSELQASVPSEVSLDLEKHPKAIGPHWIDIHHGEQTFFVEWQQQRGFLIYWQQEQAYGQAADEVFNEPHLALARIQQLLGQTEAHAPTLRDLRELFSVTQVELARRLNVGQATISKLETREEVKVSTLAAALAALGGTLQIQVRFPECSVPLQLA